MAITTGIIDENLRAVVRIELRNGLQSVTVDAVIDTGFDGAIALGTSLMARLGLVKTVKETRQLADGSIVEVGICLARVVWQGAERIVKFEEGADSEVLLGMALLADNRVTLEVRYNHAVTIEELP